MSEGIDYQKLDREILIGLREATRARVQQLMGELAAMDKALGISKPAPLVAKRQLSDAAKQRIIEAQKRRWEKHKKREESRKLVNEALAT